VTALYDAPPADSYDVVVAGSGAPALMAAAVAAERGLTVLVLERSGLLGGTSSISAGTVWVPCNPYQADAGVTDDPASALEYLTAVAGGRGRTSVLGALVDYGAPMLEFARDACGLVFDAVPDYPDYRPSLPGAAGGGRSLQPHLFNVGVLGPLASALRRDPVPPYTMAEFKAWGSWNAFPWDELQRRADAPFYGMPLQVGAFGTSGGVVTDDHARALDAVGEVIAGLFAVGNVSAHPVCAGYPGAGGTLGPALTMAYLAGLSIGAGTARRQAATSMARSE
jgi:succinate dehydrogenase/fumarate reductase flavoprotein subunit